VRVLIVDADRAWRAALRHHVDTAWPGSTVVEREVLPQANADAEEAEIVLASDSVGEDLLIDWIRRRPARGAPVVVLAGAGDEFLAVRAIKAGAADYLPKDRVRHALLVEAVQTALAEARRARAASLPADETPVLSLRGYRFLRELHRGDVSRVLLAEEGASGEERAVKVLRQVPDTGETGARLFDRFLQEYEVIRDVRQPNVVRIYDLGIADHGAYITMEYLGAGSLRARMTAGLSPAEALEYARQMAAALAAIHEAGILHRDLKPGNVMLRDDSTLVLIDFGLAKEMRLHAGLTGGGRIFGTPYYMSPEQGHGTAVDARSDLYSLGVILYEMLTGRRPFDAPTPMALIYQHRHAQRPPLPARLASLKPIVHRLLAAEPAERFQTAEEALEALS
jgi:serine/threonine protein kinase